jgi:DNA-binding transcriptional MocR family regulator
LLQYKELSDLEQYQIRGRTAREIAASAEASIRTGRVRSGDALPTVRALAAALGTSPATVGAAYRTLRERGLVIAERRRGTRVAPRPALSRARDEAHPRGEIPVPEGIADLTIGLPDQRLMPSLGGALGRIGLEAKLGVDRLEGADPELLQFARTWFAQDGVNAGAITVVSGALDGIERVLHAHLRPGDRVVIEDPGYPPIIDILVALGLIAIPVAVDDRGLIPDLLVESLAGGVAAVITIPRAQNPFGSALDAQRAAELRAVLDRYPDPLLIEDDHASAVAGAPFHSSTSPGRERWAVVRSTSKILHPDMRVAFLAGDETTIARVEGRQALGPRWVSHLLQGVAVAMLTDPSFAATCERAAQAYAERREMLLGALAAEGIRAHGSSGMNVWVELRKEAPALRALLDAGYLALSGEGFRTASPPGVRITISTLTESDAGKIAAALSRVEHARTRRRVY